MCPHGCNYLKCLIPCARTHFWETNFVTHVAVPKSKAPSPQCPHMVPSPWLSLRNPPVPLRRQTMYNTLCRSLKHQTQRVLYESHQITLSQSSWCSINFLCLMISLFSWSHLLLDVGWALLCTFSNKDWGAFWSPVLCHMWNLRGLPPNPLSSLLYFAGASISWAALWKIDWQ